MPKIKVFVTLKNNLNGEVYSKSYPGFLNQEKLVYQEEKRTVTIYEDFNTIKMIRREKENSTFLTFQKDVTRIGSFEMVGYQPLEIEVSTSLLEKRKQWYRIVYQTRVGKELMGDFDITIHYEVVE